MSQPLVRIVEQYPEECLVCGDLNEDEKGVPVFPADPSFCSSYCRDVFVAERKHKTVLESVQHKDFRPVIAAHNAKCPRCVTSPVYCFHDAVADL